MANLKLPRILEAAKEFNIGQDTLKDFLASKGFSGDVLKPTSRLTEEMYLLLDLEFDKDKHDKDKADTALPVALIENNLKTKDVYLELGKCNLTDKDFEEGSPIEHLLRQCYHLETLILSNEWVDQKNASIKTSKNFGNYNRLTKIPEFLFSFSKLKVFICGGQSSRWQIQDMQIITQLKSLSYLDISYTQINEIREFSNFENLETLILKGNLIEEMKGLDQLINLRHLDLSGNKIQEIKGLNNLNKIESLFLYSNQIKEINSLGQLSGLRKINLSFNKTQEIKGLENLKSLNELDLSANEIREIKGLENLSQLKTLNLSINPIAEIKGLGNLTGLSTLNLYSNKIQEIKGLESLKNLTSLDLRNNSIQEIKGLTTLTQLTKLDLRNNQIEEIKGIESLQRLKVLDLSRNSLKSLKGIHKLISLKRLDVSFNEIEETKGLEFLLGKKEEEIFLNIINNPLEKKYQLILIGEENHLQFIKELLKRQQDISFKINFTYPVKVLMLGNHATGKSELVNFLTKNKFTGSTHILRIVNYYKDQKAKIHVTPDAIFYDFGGQDFYHGLYQAFMSRGALYLILFNPKKDKNEIGKDDKELSIIDFNRLYWLGQKTYKESSSNEFDPFIIIQTYADEHFSKYNLQIEYFDYRGFNNNFILSLQKDLSVKNLEHEVYKRAKEYFKAYFDALISKLHQPHDEPKWYIKFLNYIMQKSDKGFEPLTLQEILNQYNPLGVSVGERLESLKTNLTTLHRHGLVLYYPQIKGLENSVWLNPQKLVEHVQNNILNKTLLEKKTETPSGVISKEVFEKIVGDKKILLLLKEQKVIFFNKPTNDSKDGEYIIPNYLPLINEKDPDNLLVIFGLTRPDFIIKFNDFIPFGLINQMICFYGKQPDVKKFWRNQLLFTIHNEAKVLIALDFENLKINVQFEILKGARATKQQLIKYLFFSITALYWNINDELIFSFDEFSSNLEQGSEQFIRKKEIWEALQSQSEYIPNDVYISLDDKRYIYYKDLFDLIIDNFKIKSYCIQNGVINKNDSKEIAVGIFEPFTNKKLPMMKKVFISYSHDDAKYRQELQNFLVNLERDGLIEIWQDGLLQAGDDWDKKIKRGLEDADICIMLMSQSFIVSNYVHEIEFRRIMEKRKNEECKIIPVLIKECDWKNWKVYPEDVLKDMTDSKDYKIGTFQFLAVDNNRLKPINKWDHPEDAWLQIIEAVKMFCTPSTFMIQPDARIS